MAYWTYTEGRQQPFTVWHRHHVVAFCSTQAEADIRVALYPEIDLKVWRDDAYEPKRGYGSKSFYMV